MLKLEKGEQLPKFHIQSKEFLYRNSHIKNTILLITSLTLDSIWLQRLMQLNVISWLHLDAQVEGKTLEA